MSNRQLKFFSCSTIVGYFSRIRASRHNFPPRSFSAFCVARSSCLILREHTASHALCFIREPSGDKHRRQKGDDCEHRHQQRRRARMRSRHSTAHGWQRRRRPAVGDSAAAVRGHSKRFRRDLIRELRAVARTSCGGGPTRHPSQAFGGIRSPEADCSSQGRRIPLGKRKSRTRRSGFRLLNC